MVSWGMAEAPPKKMIVVVVVLVALIIAGVVFLDGKEPPGRVTTARLAELQASISEYAKKHGAPPETLAELPGENSPVDAWNQPLTYRVLGDGRVEIASLGADGKPGGHMFKADRIVTFFP